MPDAIPTAPTPEELLAFRATVRERGREPLPGPALAAHARPVRYLDL